MVYYDILRSWRGLENISVRKFKWDSHVKGKIWAVLGVKDPQTINLEDSSPQKAHPFAGLNRLMHYM